MFRRSISSAVNTLTLEASCDVAVSPRLAVTTTASRSGASGSLNSAVRRARQRGGGKSAQRGFQPAAGACGVDGEGAVCPRQGFGGGLAVGIECPHVSAWKRAAGRVRDASGEWIGEQHGTAMREKKRRREEWLHGFPSRRAHAPVEKDKPDRTYPGSPPSPRLARERETYSGGTAWALHPLPVPAGRQLFC